MEYAADLPRRETEIFLRTGLDGQGKSPFADLVAMGSAKSSTHATRSTAHFLVLKSGDFAASRRMAAWHLMVRDARNSVLLTMRA
jgi:hypothetical protein